MSGPTNVAYLCAALAAASLSPSLKAQHGATSQVSVLAGCGTEPIGLGHASSAGISADGRYVVFRSASTAFPGEAVLAWFPNLDGAGSFGPLQPITSQLDVPTGVVIASLDSDGWPDIVTSSKQDDKVAWYVNDLPFSGTFVGPTVIAQPSEGAPTVSTGDMDGDGDVDVLSVAYGDSLNTTRWFANDGRGQFTSATDINNYAYAANGLFPADCDGDGDLDVLTSGGFPTLSWDENIDGAGGFTSEHIIETSADGPVAVRAADLDGDGDRDVVAASTHYPAGPQIRWYRNLDGQGQFQPEVQLVAGEGIDPRAIDVADLDLDGDVDVLAALRDFEIGDRLVWFANDGTGHFATQVAVDGPLASIRWVGAADLDGDGDLDVLMAAAGTAQLAWYSNLDGQGTFGSKQLIGAAVPKAESARPADLDGDGDLDVVLARGTDDEVCFFINLDGHGHFGNKQVLTTNLDNASSVDVFDPDSDGDLDVLVVSSIEGRVGWHPNLGAGVFGAEQAISAGFMHPRTIAGADMDGDGDDDVLAFAPAGEVTAWFENVDASGTTFSAHVIQDVFASDSAGMGAVPTDLDEDGDIDALVAGGEGGDFSWFENHGEGRFGKTHVIDQTTPARSVFGADLDGDSDVDAIAAFPDANRIAWYRNEDGLGNYGPSLDITALAVGARSVFAADMDGDRDLDVLAASPFDDTVRWFENLDGNGSFGSGTLVTSTADGVQQVVCADVDRDGDTDALSVSFDDNVAAWHENLDGIGGSFAAHVIHDGPAVGARAVAAGDVDSDGDVDVVMTGSFPSPIGGEIYRHDLALRETVWVSQTLNGGESASVEAVISANGRFVGFRGGGALDPDPKLWGSGLFVNDTVTGVTARVDLCSTGEVPNNVSQQLSLSGDGRYAAFSSYANNLVPGDPTCCSKVDAFLRDRLLGTTIVLNRMPDGSWAAGPSSTPIVSADGRHVAFLASSPLVAEDTNGVDDVYDYEIATSVITRVSLATGGAQIGGSGITSFDISGDGSVVAFTTKVALDPLDLNSFVDVYVHDRRTLETSLVSSISSAGLPVMSGGTEPRVSADGRYVLFIGGGADLVPETTTPMPRPYRRDRLTGTLELMGIASDGTPANQPILTAVISGDGSRVAFASAADNLVPSDTDDLVDVHVHGVEPWTSLGCGDSGAAGPAALQGSGSLLPDSKAALLLSGGPPSTPAVLFVSLQSLPAAFKGGTLVALPPLLSQPLATGPTGGFALSFRWPVGFSSGTTVYLHLAIADGTASEGVALSNALLAVTP